MSRLCNILLLAFSVLNTAQINLQPASIRIWEVNDGCTSEGTRKLLHSETEKILNDIIVQQLCAIGLFSHLPANSCADIYHGHPSGYYWLNGGHGLNRSTVH